MRFTDELDAQIEAAATAAYGSARVSIQEHTVPEEWCIDFGRWFALFIDSELLGRRRSKTELLEMLHRKAG